MGMPTDLADEAASSLFSFTVPLDNYHNLGLKSSPKIGHNFLRLLSSDGKPTLVMAAQGGVQMVSQTVADKVGRHHNQRDSHARE